jgi:hypothetical protein
MTGILPPPPDPPMHPLGLPHVPAALKGADPMLRIPVEPKRFQALPVTSHGRILEPQIDPHRLLRRGCLLNTLFHGQA